MQKQSVGVPENVVWKEIAKTCILMSFPFILTSINCLLLLIYRMIGFEDAEMRNARRQTTKISYFKDKHN